METVEVKPDRIRALKFYFPILVLSLLLFLYAAYIAFADIKLCEYLFNYNFSIITLIVACYILPGYALLCTLWISHVCYKTLKTHYYPPLDIPVFFSTTAKRGNLSRLRGFVGVVTPLFGIWVLFLGHNAFVETNNGKTVSEAFIHMDKFCEQMHKK